MRIKVARFLDTSPADLIVEELLTTEQAMTERARNELDYLQFNRANADIDQPLQSHIQPGDLVLIGPSTHEADAWIGKVLSVQIKVGRPGITQTLRLDRVLFIREET